MTGDSADIDRIVGSSRQIVTSGIHLVEDALRAQGLEPATATWRPPLRGVEAAALAQIALSNQVRRANTAARQRLVSCRPHLVGVAPASQAIGLEPGAFLHAGPPIDWQHASGPLRGALTGAAVAEGLADSPASAAARFKNRHFSLEPCHHRDAVGPMAGVVSPSMPMFVIEDPSSAARAHCTLNEGLGRVLRYGANSDDVIERLRWMSDVLAPILDQAIRRHDPIDLWAIVSEALQMGDECHNRNRAATSLFLRTIGASLHEMNAPSRDLADCFVFVAGNDHFFLNLTMPAAKLAADSARNIEGSTVVVAMARNGTEFGIQLAGTGDDWFTGPSSIPQGLLFSGYSHQDANPDIGDSTITETVGLGGFAMAAAPAVVGFVGGSAATALDSTLSMYDITVGEHPTFRIPALEFQGTPTGIDASIVCRTGILPVINTGIAGKQPGTGQIGAGMAQPPAECFVAAIDRFSNKHKQMLKLSHAHEHP